MWTSARRLRLASGDHALREGLVRGGNTAQQVALRARIILGAAEGLANNRLARQLGVTRPTILLWRQRYAQAGVAGLLRDAPRPFIWTPTASTIMKKIKHGKDALDAQQ